MGDIPFVKDFEFEYGRLDRLSPLIERVIAENPGPFTFTGTGVYIIGDDPCAVIDPGPDLPRHFSALKSALAGRRLSHVLVTHSHLDHCPLAHPLARWAGCKVYGGRLAAPGAQGRFPETDEVKMEEGDDRSFKPDVYLEDGEILGGDGWTIEAIATPGHASNHFCFALKEENALFSGDHIMGWSTTVVSPPDGDMADYMASLDKIRRRNFTTLWPTHGTKIESPDAFIDAYRDHRLAREQAILDRLAAGDETIPDMVSVIYKDVDKRLHPAACRSVLAHMIHLVDRGQVETDHPRPGLSDRYRRIA